MPINISLLLTPRLASLNARFHLANKLCVGIIEKGKGGINRAIAFSRKWQLQFVSNRAFRFAIGKYMVFFLPKQMGMLDRTSIPELTKEER